MMCEYFRYQSTNSKPLRQAVETGHMQVLKCDKIAAMSLTVHGQTRYYCLHHGYDQIEFLETNANISYSH